MWPWIKKNPWIAGAFVILCLAALGSAYDSYRHRGMLAESKKAEKAQAAKIETLEKEGAAKDEAFRKAIGATEPALRGALAGVREAKASLAQVEAGRRELWTPPAVDNGDLVARFEKALEGLR
jgi:hypothetical protein